MKASLIIILLINYINSQITLLNDNLEDNGVNFSFTTSFINTFGVIFVSEIADKTFILLLFFSMRTSKFKLFIVSSVSLLTMNLFTVLIGYSIPLLLYRSLIDWLAIITFFIFGIYLLQEAYNMPHKTLQVRYEKYSNKRELHNYTEIQTHIDTNAIRQPLTRDNEANIESAYQESENKLLLGFFTSLMLAECGDRSQLATITLGAVYELYGTILGTSAAHILCNLIAIFTGSYLAKHLSEKQMNYVGGVIFLLMSIHILIIKLKLNLF